MFSKITLQARQEKEEKEKLISWSKQRNAPIYRIYFTGGENRLGVFIFYKTDAELKKHIESGMVEKTKHEYLQTLETFGKINNYDSISFDFDTDENVKRRHNGNYSWKLHDG